MQETHKKIPQKDLKNAKKPKEKLSEKFKQLSQQQLRKEPPIYLISCIKDKNIILDLDLLQPDDIVFLPLLMSLPITKIHLFCQEGKKISSTTAPIYNTTRFKDVLKELGNAVINGQVFRSLIFERVPLTTKQMMMLKQCIEVTQNLKELSLRHCNLTDDHLQTIKTAIAKNESLVILDLSHNKLANAGGMVGKIMSEHSARRDELIWFASLRGESLQDDLSKKGICQVNLQGNDLNDKAALELVSFLKDDQWSRCLNLRNNKLTEEGVQQFAKLMKKNSSLISLDLRGNPGFSKQFSMYILKKLKQNIEKYREEKKNYTKNKKQENNLGGTDSKNALHKSLQQSRHQSLHKKIESQHLEFSIEKNNITSVHKSHKNQLGKHQPNYDGYGCSKCKQKTLDMLKLQKYNLDLQFEIKKLRRLLLTRNIDVSAILPHSQPHNHNNSHSIQPSGRALQVMNLNMNSMESDEDLIAKVEQIMNELTKIMENIDAQQNTQINISNNISNAHSLSNTIPLFAHPSELDQLEDSSIRDKEDKEDKDNKATDKDKSPLLKLKLRSDRSIQ